MNLNKQMELASAIFGSEPATGVERVSATATADSAGGEVTVQFEDGSTLAVPVTGAVKSGDEVIVNVQNGTPVGAGSVGWGDRVQQIAEDADAIATAVNQHFWHRSTDPDGDGAGTGAFVTDEAQDDFLTAAAGGFADYDPSTKPYRNVLMNSLGFLIREALHNLASFTQSAVSFFDGSGNTTATFGTSGAVVGRSDGNNARIEVADGGLSVITHYINPDRDVREAFIGVENWVDTHWTFGQRTGTVGQYSAAIGANNLESSGRASVALGSNTHATGDYSQAQNASTTAASDYQTVIGRNNVVDSADTYAFIVGNGTDPDWSRSNAFTVAWNGDITASGKVVNGSGDTLTGYKVTRFVPSSTTAQTLSTSADKVWYIDSATVDTAGVTTDGQGTYTIPEAGTWRIKLHCGMYPNTTAKTRLCCGIYMSSITGTRLALGVQQMYNATANSATQVVCVDCEYIGTFSASDKVVIGAFADVTNAKIYRPSGDLTCITFEKVG